MDKLKICVLLFFWSMSSLASDDRLSRGTKLAVEAEVHFFETLLQTYPDLIKSDEAITRIKSRLAFSKKTFKEKYFWETQKLIFDEFEENWYEIVEPLRSYSIRTSAYGVHKFKKLLYQLMSVSGYDEFPSVLIPACGKFYESDTVVNLLNPEKVLAIDINNKDIEFSRAMQTNSRVTYLQSDLEQKIKDTSLYDLVLFLHPSVIDTEKKYAIKNDVSSLINVTTHKLNDARLSDSLNENWKSIINNSLIRLKLNGYALFVFYSIEEMEELNAWLAKDSSLKIKSRFVNPGLVSTQFTQFLLTCTDHTCMNEMQAAVFGAYRAALIVQKSPGL